MELVYFILSSSILYFFTKKLGFFKNKKPAVNVIDYEKNFNKISDKIVGINTQLHISIRQKAIKKFYNFYKSDSRVKLNCELMQLTLDAKKKRICNKGVWL